MPDQVRWNRRLPADQPTVTSRLRRDNKGFLLLDGLGEMCPGQLQRQAKSRSAGAACRPWSLYIYGHVGIPQTLFSGCLQKGGAISACSIYKSTLCMIAMYKKRIVSNDYIIMVVLRTLLQRPSAKENFPETLTVTIGNLLVFLSKKHAMISPVGGKSRTSYVPLSLPNTKPAHLLALYQQLLAQLRQLLALYQHVLDHPHQTNRTNLLFSNIFPCFNSPSPL